MLRQILLVSVISGIAEKHWLDLSTILVINGPSVAALQLAVIDSSSISSGIGIGRCEVQVVFVLVCRRSVRWFSGIYSMTEGREG